MICFAMLLRCFFLVSNDSITSKPDTLILNKLFYFVLIFFHFHCCASSNICYTAIIPNVSSEAETKEFLLKVVDILIDYVKTQNDRSQRILEFHHPEDMKKMLDLDLPENALPLQQLIEDCATTMRYQVKTGEYDFLYIYFLFPSASVRSSYHWVLGKRKYSVDCIKIREWENLLCSPVNCHQN